MEGIAAGDLSHATINYIIVLEIARTYDCRIKPQYGLMRYFVAGILQGKIPVPKLTCDISWFYSAPMGVAFTPQK